jgi:hypothetical protein
VLRHASDLKINVISPDTVEGEVDFHVFMHVDNPNYKLKQAFFNCMVTDSPSVDTFKNIIKGCHNMLVIESDTVRIYLTLNKGTGQYKFERVTLLTVDKDQNYYYDTCTFRCYVK